jgi:pyruvate dehydrogenase E1 component beta subunit
MSGGNVSCSIVFRGPNGSASRVAAQHSQCFASWYAHCPGLKVISPYTASDHKMLLKAAIKDPNPVVFLEHELIYGDKYDIDENFDNPIEIGKAKICKEGTDITIVGFSIAMRHINNALSEIENLGISVEIIDLLTLRPLDIDTIITSVKKTNRLLCVEDGWAFAGIGSEIAFQVNEFAFDYLDAPIGRVCQEDVPLPYASNLEKAALVNSEKIVNAVRKIMNL